MVIDVRSPSVQFLSRIFMQFSGKLGQIIGRRRPVQEILDPPLNNDNTEKARNLCWYLFTLTVRIRIDVTMDTICFQIQYHQPTHSICYHKSQR